MSTISRQSSDAMGGMMAMAPGVPSLSHMQHVFGAFVGAAIGFATIANVLNKILCYQRTSTSRNVAHPAKPRSFFFQAHATTAAIVREISYYSQPLSFRNRKFHLPPTGLILIIIAYMVLIVVCVFYKLNPKDLLQWEDIAYRAGYIAVCQLPLIVVFAGKRNIIGFLSGAGYERLAWLHRWFARALLFTVLIHMGYFVREWAKFNYVGVKIKTDVLTQRGIAAGAVLLWIILSSTAPIRSLSYEFFLTQHIISWLGFFTALYFHIPNENKIWIWLPLAFWALDRIIRACYTFYTNLSFLHNKHSTNFLSCKATFEPLDEKHTRITIPKSPITWTPGQHLFLTCHALAPFSSHPFTIASLPSDSNLELIVRSRRGETKQFHQHAQTTFPPSLPLCISDRKKEDNVRAVLIDGPCGTIRPLRQFDSLLFVAGSTGATFTVPLLRDVVRAWQSVSNRLRSQRSSMRGLELMAGIVTRYIRFVWVVKRRAAIGWFEAQLEQAAREVQSLRIAGHDINVDIRLHVTGGEECDAEEQGDKSSNDQKILVSEEETLSSSSDPLLVPDENSRAATRINDHTSALTLLFGRPHIPTLIHEIAEQACGEMAVVVCGPQGLVQCTRNAVCTVSNERAVHKGTGAQGIYLHAEAFGYA